jgi:hypothetical protein
MLDQRKDVVAFREFVWARHIATPRAGDGHMVRYASPWVWLLEKHRLPKTSFKGQCVNSVLAFSRWYWRDEVQRISVARVSNTHIYRAAAKYSVRRCKFLLTRHRDEVRVSNIFETKSDRI